MLGADDSPPETAALAFELVVKTIPPSSSLDEPTVWPCPVEDGAEGGFVKVPVLVWVAGLLRVR